MTRLAHQFLPEGVSDEWLELLRPAVHLVPVTGSDQPVVARLGGQPSLPVGMPWPEWGGVGPLSFIGELDCAALSAFDLDITLPRTGRLMAFYFDGSYDQGMSIVGTWDRASLAGARLIHVPDDTACAPRAAPEGLYPYVVGALTGKAIVTAPGWDHPVLRNRFMRPEEDHRSFMDHPVNGDAFNDALHERHSGPLHQIGGFADPVQGPVEHEVASAALNNEVTYSDPRLDAEAARWTLVWQVDTDDARGMMWGDCGALYWLGRQEQLAAGHLSEISFTWQCS